MGGESQGARKQESHKTNKVVTKCVCCDCDKYCKVQQLSQIFDEASESFSSDDGRSEGPVAENVTRQ